MDEIARDLHAWPADQDFPWRRPRGGLPVAPAAEGFSFAATLQRHSDKRARPLLQTGTVPAAPPDSGGRWDVGEAQPLPDPWILPLWYLPADALAHATQDVKGAFPPPQTPWRSFAPQPAGGGGLGTVAKGERTSGLVLLPGAGSGAASRRGHGDDRRGGDRACHGVQMDNGCRPATHAAATGVPAPSTSGPPFGPPPRPHTGRVDGPTE